MKRSLFVLFLILIIIGCSEQEQKRPKEGSLDLEDYDFKLLYETDFEDSLNVVREMDLFDGKQRIKKPVNADWVLEGPGSAWTENGELFVSNSNRNNPDKEPFHMVIWNTREFPENILVEFGFKPKDPLKGLAIIFFAATGKNGGSIFDLDKPARRGNFVNYHSGAINCYHCSYWAIVRKNLQPRKNANLRKNFGKYLVARGKDLIWDQGTGPHHVRLFKFGGDIRLETNGELAFSWTDVGVYGPVLGKGHVGLRTMVHTELASYTYFRVWEIVPSESN